MSHRSSPVFTPRGSHEHIRVGMGLSREVQSTTSRIVNSCSRWAMPTLLLVGYLQIFRRQEVVQAAATEALEVDRNEVIACSLDAGDD